jgi:hypothetical protein
MWRKYIQRNWIAKGATIDMRIIDTMTEYIKVYVLGAT